MRTTERLPATAECIGAARTLVTGALRSVGCSTENVDTARLLVSELATNVVRHAHSAEMTVAVDTERGVARVSVGDQDGRMLPEPVLPGGAAPSGRGLYLVAVLSMRWGVDQHDDDGKAVWFEVAC